MNKIGVCLFTSRKDTIIKLLGGHFSDQVVEKIKKGKVFYGTGDNWYMRILKGSMRMNIQNEDLHLFATNLIENRLTFSHLPNEKPKGNIKDLPRSTFSLSMNEWRQYADNAKVIVGRIVLQFLPQFKFLIGIVPERILYVHSKEMEWQ